MIEGATMKLHLAAQRADVIRYFEEFAGQPDPSADSLEALMTPAPEVTAVSEGVWEISEPYMAFHDLVATVRVDSARRGSVLEFEYEVRSSLNGRSSQPPYVKGLNAGVNRGDEFQSWAKEFDAYIAKQLRGRGRGVA